MAAMVSSPTRRRTTKDLQSSTPSRNQSNTIPNLLPNYDYDLPKYQCPLEPPEPVQFGDALPAYLWNLIIISLCMYAIPPLFETTLNPASTPTPIPFSPTQYQGEYYHPYFAALLIFYYFFALIIRWLETDAHVFYEHCWACNYVMLASAYGMLTGSPLYTGLSCVIVAVDQMCWYLDLAGFAIFCKYYIGVAKYLSNPNTSFAKKLTAWHHLWFLPLMLYTLKWTLPPCSFLVGSIMASLMSLVARTSIPFYCLSLLRDPITNKFNVIYLNVNCPYAFWEDIPFPFLHWFNHQSPLLYIPYLFFIANVVLNLPAVLIMTVILMPFNGIYDLAYFS